MLRASLWAVSHKPCLVLRRGISSSLLARNQEGNNGPDAQPVDEMDPGLGALIHDIDMSIKKAKSAPRVPHPELEILSEGVLPEDPDWDTPLSSPLGRKSPAADFGSKSIGTVVLPLELQTTINSLMAAMDRHMLREDAKRIFSQDAENWTHIFNETYRSPLHSRRAGERDGAAFAAVALPAHFSAIYAVLTHLKHRVGPLLNVTRVIDWGAGCGSGFWASAYAFQDHSLTRHDDMDFHVKDSSLDSYCSIEKRQGLRSIATRLLGGIDLNGMAVSFRRKFNIEAHALSPSKGKNALALSAFALSSVPNPLGRAVVAKEMWSSGAEFIVIIDHNTPEGFQHVAEAREQILALAQKELDDLNLTDNVTRGAHVVAPCPHDGRCPLYAPGPHITLVCGFSQRLQRPDFVRRTKRSTFGHEDIEYSYVVIRRGPRPTPLPGPKVGRIGLVALREGEGEVESPIQGSPLAEASKPTLPAENESPAEGICATDISQPSEALLDVENNLRCEAYLWPRLVFPPIKAHKHIILDSCTAEGKIMRMTIPKSQGKQPYYDARKSSWGDIFPHPPKNKPQERQISRKGQVVEGQDIGKRKHRRQKQPVTYESIARELKARRRPSRRERLDPRTIFAKEESVDPEPEYYQSPRERGED